MLCSMWATPRYHASGFVDYYRRLRPTYGALPFPVQMEEWDRVLVALGKARKVRYSTVASNGGEQRGGNEEEGRFRRLPRGAGPVAWLMPPYATPCEQQDGPSIRPRTCGAPLVAVPCQHFRSASASNTHLFHPLQRLSPTGEPDGGRQAQPEP